jgi:hypothetical protein
MIDAAINVALRNSGACFDHPLFHRKQASPSAFVMRVLCHKQTSATERNGQANRTDDLRWNRKLVDHNPHADAPDHLIR